MQVFLELSGHPKANVQRVVLARTTVIGRSKECGLQIASGSVSRKHCEVRIGGGGVSVVDLGSSNGTFVDNERLPAGESRPLASGARLNVGGVRFAVTFAGPVPATAPEAARPDARRSTPAPLPTESPILDDEPLVDEDVILLEEPILPQDPAPVAAAPHAGKTETISVADDDLDFDALFADEPVSAPAKPPAPAKPSAPARPTVPANVVADDAPIVVDEEDEPILGSDEDDAFAFLTDDAPSGRESPPEDSKLGAR